MHIILQFTRRGMRGGMLGLGGGGPRHLPPRRAGGGGGGGQGDRADEGLRGERSARAGSEAGGIEGLWDVTWALDDLAGGRLAEGKGLRDAVPGLQAEQGAGDKSVPRATDAGHFGGRDR